jgi:asparagine synthase (glutamine-hydrolysing)
MSTPDGSLTLIYNGEIYNAPRLRERLSEIGCAFRTRSDTEVLLHALDRWGLADTLEALRGMFAFVALRERGGASRVMAAVDHAGMKPLAWRFDANAPAGATLSLASTCDALEALFPEPPQLDPHSMLDVMTIGYCPAPRTMWQGMQKLAAGTCLAWDVGRGSGPRVRRWWSPPAGVGDATADTDDAFADLLGDVAGEHLIGDVPVGMFLSGGLDSMSLAVSLHRRGRDVSGIRAFTLVSGDPSDEDGPASDIAGRLGMPWTRVAFEPGGLLAVLDDAARLFDEPQGYTALLTATKIAESLRHSAPATKVVLGGDGGDEALGGYAWHRDRADHPLSLAGFASPTEAEVREHDRLAVAAAQPDADDATRAAALRALGCLSFTHRYLVRTFGGFHPSEAAALLGVPAPDTGDMAVWLAPEDRLALPSIRRAQRLDVMGFCPGSILPKLDRACMGVGLELRAPFLDRRVLEYGLARPVAPGEFEPRGSKPALRRMLERAAGPGLVDRAVLERPKQGFSLRFPDGVFEQLVSAVEGSSLVSDGLLRPDWARYLTGNPEMRRVRLFTLAFIASWHTHRRAR